MQISKTSFGFGNNRGRRPRLLPNPTSVFDICSNTSNSLIISIIYLADRLTNCLMSPYINDFDEDMDWTLPDGHVIRGFESYHDNSKE